MILATHTRKMVTITLEYNEKTHEYEIFAHWLGDEKKTFLELTKSTKDAENYYLREVAKSFQTSNDDDSYEGGWPFVMPGN